MKPMGKKDEQIEDKNDAEQEEVKDFKPLELNGLY